MSELSEIDAMAAVAKALGSLEVAEQERVLRWACDKYMRRTHGIVPENGKNGVTQHPPISRKKSRKDGAKPSKAKAAVVLVKDLNLRPKGKKSFEDFAGEKQPTSNSQKCVVCAYYLHHELELESIAISHIFTCFKEMKWRVPTDLANTLAHTASAEGWLETKNMDNITTTTRGENLVEHDLPKSSAAK